MCDFLCLFRNDKVFFEMGCEFKALNLFFWLLCVTLFRWKILLPRKNVFWEPIELRSSYSRGKFYLYFVCLHSQISELFQRKERTHIQEQDFVVLCAYFTYFLNLCRKLDVLCLYRRSIFMLLLVTHVFNYSIDSIQGYIV